jgi:hypothetical protein
LVGYPLPVRFAFDAAETLCLGVSAGTIRDIAVIAATLERLWTGDVFDLGRS